MPEDTSEFPETKPTIPVANLDASEIRAIVWASNEYTQTLFRKHFGEEIERAIQILGDAYTSFQTLESAVFLDERTATVQMFIHVAIGSVVASIHHLVSGYPIAAGNMMRHFTEATAMALMCSDESTGIYQRYIADQNAFPVHKSPEMLRRKPIKKALKASLSFDSEAWETVLDIAKLYDTLSHVSPTTLGFHMLFTEGGGLVVGSEFDPEKLSEYRSDVSRRRSAAESLAHVIPIIMGALPQKQ
jgi:hypothetical protein